ncbi:glycosyltransferase family protein 92 [Canna indica]|uniref:Glycosyltransferase family 92 protein n=1 Tax=Canna indica TaxID=4628 RepID=A0AAQ3JRI0_9LILI|nr:glycosyltransferase family protein 92 [Canna indica]
MRDRRRAGGGGRAVAKGSSSALFSWSTLFAFLFCALFASVALSTFRIFGVSFRPVLLPTWQTSAISAIASDHSFLRRQSTKDSSIHIQEAISFPDQVLIFLQFPTFLPKSNLLCLYYPPNKSSSRTPEIQLTAILPSFPPPFIRCPLGPRGFSISLSPNLPPLQPRPWDHLAYAALLDPYDNSTIVFAKGFNLRSDRFTDPSRFECVFGWNFAKPKYLLTSPALTAAQEIFRCITPTSILLRLLSLSDPNPPPLVSVQTKGRGAVTLPSVARPDTLLPWRRKQYTMCVCTMLRNQAKFLPEWIIYHDHIGVERWFIYDNDSDDDIEKVIELLAMSSNYKVTRHLWPWVKTQEAGFAHCALRARGDCEWVGFIDVDEFLYLPSNITLHGILQNYSSIPSVAELRTTCYSFGPSGRKTMPLEGVILGYTCRVLAPERHKSIVRPEALNHSLINVVHHFHLKDGMKYVNMEKGLMGINHYKYQVWEVFKEKFYRRVATYVADWQNQENVGSKDRAPGLGTKPVEPPDWPSRFCEVNDTGLRDWVSEVFIDPQTGLLPWQEGDFNLIHHTNTERVDNKKKVGK